MRLFTFLMTLAWIITGGSLFAQAPDLELNLRYNTTLARYEVYARPSATQSSFSWGPSQISVVTPAAVPDAPFNVTSVIGGAWQDNSDVYAPTIAPGSDFHGIGSLGAPTNFTAGVERLVFYFTLPGGICVPGLRLYINGVDPTSSDPGMAGGDFANTIFSIVPGVPTGYEAYAGNYNNGGTSCNSAPVANNDTPSTPEDNPLTFNPLSNDTDDGGFLPGTLDLDPTTPGIQTSFTVPGQGTFVANPTTGEVTFTPVTNFNGTTTPITYNVCDNGTPQLCDDATITVTVTAVNDAPIANNDTQTTTEDTPVTFSATGNDTDVDGAINPATLDLDPATPGVQTSFTVAGQGTFVANPTTGDVTFTPVANFNGTTTPITYNVCDNGTPLPAQCDDATITVTVTAVNDAPIANNDTQTTTEDTPVTISATGNDTDVDGAINPATLDLDPATPGVQTTFTVAGQGTFVANPTTGDVTFSPVANFNGTSTITYNVCDNGTPLPAQCDDATITVTVTAVNDAPIANNDTQTTTEDTPVTFSATGNDTDVDGTINPATLDLDPATPGVQTTFTVAGQGTFVANPTTGDVTFTPVANFNGTSTITYNVCDNGTPLPAQCDDATITVTVNAVNDAPIANNDTPTTTEDNPITFSATGNDTDVDGTINPATLDLDPATPGVQTTFTVPGQGTFVANPTTGEVTFTPVANFNGTSTITYNVCDNGTPLPAQCDDATITVTVTAVNDAPIANNDAATTTEDNPITFSATGNDTDVDGTINPATLDLDPATPGVQTSFTVAGQGTFVANPTTGEVTFTPVANFNGTSTITYNVCDNGTPLPAQCDDATITVTVNGVNDAPIANNDTPTTTEDNPITFSATGNDTDVDGTINPATLDLDPATPGVQTTFTVAGQGTFVANPTTGEVTFTPVANFNGTSTITYNVCDNGTPLPAQCDDATIAVTVTAVNDAPIANNDTQTTTEDNPVTFSATGNDTDVDGTINPATLDLDPATPGVQTTFTVAGQGTFVANPTTGDVTFTPVANFNGTSTITYNVCDNGTPLPALCDDATITVTVTPTNDPPTITQPPVSTPEDNPIVICPTLGDPDAGAVLTVSLCNVPMNGNAVVGPGNCITFTPANNYNGSTTICIQVCDQGGLCATVNVPVTVTPVNDAPIANNDTPTTPEDNPITFSVTGNDTDVDGTIDPATLDLDPTTPGVQTTFTVPGQGTFVANPTTGEVTFTPVANFTGTTTPITYNVCDNGTPLPAQCDDATITVTVTAVNDAPIANNDTQTTTEDNPVTFSVTGNDTDVDGAINPATLDLDPATPGVQTSFTVAGQGTFVANPTTGEVTFTPVANFNGTSTITYNVCDNGTPLPAQCDDATITVTVTPVNDAPIANNDAPTTTEDNPITFSATGNDTDVDGTINPATLDLDPTTPGVQTSFTVAGQGTFVANPTTGDVTFTPVANFTGTTTPITYNVCDNGTPLPAQCDDATITVTVAPVNDPPTITQPPVSTPEDNPIVICPTLGDPDAGAVLTVSLCNVPMNGNAVVGPGNCITFTPANNYNGSTTICIQVCDQGGLCATVNVPVTVTPVNDAPIANNDTPTTPEDNPITFSVTGNDTDVDGTIDPATLDLDPATPGIQTTFTVPGQGTFVANPTTGEVTFTPVANYSGTTTPITYSVCDNGTPLPAQCAQATITVTVVFDPIAKLQLKVLLQGALIGTSDGLMRDDLRTNNLIPLTEPYTALANPRFTHVGGGGETTTAAVLAANAGTPNAIVDWVFVELRSAVDSSVVLHTRSALLQRDGDVVSATDGTSRLGFLGLVGQQFFVSVKHRNHLGAMTSAKSTLVNDGTLVDFTTANDAQLYDRPGAINYNGAEMTTVQGKRALWAGNANANTKVKYQGTSSDNVSVLTPVLNHPGNTLGTYNFNAAFGYYPGDINMDGKVKYQGTFNDASYIFINVVGLYTTLNTSGLYNYDLFLEQLP